MQNTDSQLVAHKTPVKRVVVNQIPQEIRSPRKLLSLLFSDMDPH